MLTDPIIIDSQLMSVLERYIDTNVDDVTCLIAKFLNMFVNDSPYLESHEVDNFILRNGRTLCAWYAFCWWCLVLRFDPSSVHGISTTSSVPTSPASGLVSFFESLSSTPNRSKFYCRTTSGENKTGNGGMQDSYHLRYHHMTLPLGPQFRVSNAIVSYYPRCHEPSVQRGGSPMAIQRYRRLLLLFQGSLGRRKGGINHDMISPGSC